MLQINSTICKQSGCITITNKQNTSNPIISSRLVFVAEAYCSADEIPRMCCPQTLTTFRELSSDKVKLIKFLYKRQSKLPRCKNLYNRITTKDKHKRDNETLRQGISQHKNTWFEERNLQKNYSQVSSVLVKHLRAITLQWVRRLNRRQLTGCNLRRYLISSTIQLSNILKKLLKLTKQ